MVPAFTDRLTGALDTGLPYTSVTSATRCFTRGRARLSTDAASSNERLAAGPGVARAVILGSDLMPSTWTATV